MMIVTDRLRRTVAALAFALLAPLAAGAQKTSEPPRLDKGADVNDWRYYQDCGATHENRDTARRCLEWAHRLNPARAEPLYALWMLGGQKEDSLQARALLLDPFVFHARVRQVVLPPLDPSETAATRGWVALVAGAYNEASQQFGTWLRTHPDSLDERWGLAISLYYRQRYDSSAAQLHMLELGLDRTVRERVVSSYHSHEFIRYMQATAFHFAGHSDSARAALGRALEENLSFYPAHALLGDIALAEHDTATATREWEQAHELLGTDAVARRRYALFLYRTHRPADAERELRAVLAQEPEWRDAQVDLASAIEAQGDARKADAIAAYEAWLAHAPLVQAAGRNAVAARLAALRGG